MSTLKVSETHVVTLINKLSPKEKRHILERLLFESDTRFASACRIGEQAFQKVCLSKNVQCDKLTEEEKLSLIDDILHETD